MRTMIKAVWSAALLLGVAALASAEDKKADTKKSIDEAIEKAVAFLKPRQAKDGSWSKANSPGITGLVLTGLFQSGGVKADEEVGEKGLKFIEAMIDAKEGHIAAVPEGTKGFQKNYITAVNVLALKASGQTKYKAAIDKAAKFLKTLQWDETQEKTKKDAFYGGVGYTAKLRPDMSNSLYFSDALKAAGITSKDEAYQKLVYFVSRCQNLKGEHNDQPWADKINDGSFIYVLGGGKGKGKGKEVKEDEKRPGYGSMTFAGLKLLTECGVPKDDQRVTKALEWVRNHYTVEGNPGLPESESARGYYSYVAVMAKCLDTLGIDEITDAKGTKHDWRAELAAALIKRQRKDGSWANEADRWMEGNPEVCTAYALIALSRCKTKAK